MEHSPGQLNFMVGVMLVAVTPFLSHLIIIRLFRGLRTPDKRQKGVAISAVVGLLLVLSFCIPRLYFGSTENSATYIPDFIYLLLIYGAAAYSYFHFFNMSETSRRIRILVSGSCGDETAGLAFAQSYSINQMIANRLDRLVSLGELTISDGKYRIGRGLLLLPAKIVESSRHVLFPEDLPKTTPWPAIFSFMAATAGLAVIMNTGRMSALPAPYDGIIQALACGVVGTVAFSLLSPSHCLKNYLLVAAPYLSLSLSFVLSVGVPGGDSQNNHFPVFQFFAEAVANGFGTPTWLPVDGGVEVGYYHINYFPFIPQRLAGYGVATLFPISIVTVYKLQLVLGVLLFTYGWYAVIAHLTGSQYAAYWGAICIALGGNGITLHQEQVIATSHLLPWFVFCLLKLRQQRLYLLPASALFGLGLSTHYPQIQLIAMLLAAMAILLWQRPAFTSWLVIGRRFSLGIALLLLVGSLPSLYIWHYSDRLASGIRAMEDLRPASYQEYAEMNKQQSSSASPSYFSQYVRPYHEVTRDRIEEPPDVYGMFVGRISLLLGMVGLIFRPAVAIPVAMLSILASELTLGINSHLSLPKLLFEAGFPFINVFRQWYHFFPLVNFCLSLLAALGFAVLSNHADGGRPRSQKYAVLAVVFLNFLDLAYYDHRYLQNYGKETPLVSMQESFSANESPLTMTTFQYKDRFKLTRDCPKAIPTTPFITTGYTATKGGVDAERVLACELAGQAVVTTNIPNDMLRDMPPSGGIINAATQKVTPLGVSYLVETPVPSLLVSLANYSLGASAYVDGKPAQVWRVNSALSGLLLEAGAHTVEFRKSGGWYAVISWLQGILYGWTALMLIGLEAAGGWKKPLRTFP